MSGQNSYPQGVVWEYPPSSDPALTQPVRSEIAYDPVAPVAGGGTVAAVYFQCNDGKTYSLNATTGALRWQHDTGNQNGPPTAADHPVPWSCAPVLDLYGTVYVGSANGYLYCLNPTDGSQPWRVKVNASGLTTNGEPIEATPAIAENGWIYVATRVAGALPGGDAVSHVYAIDPTRSFSNPDNASEKIVWTSDTLSTTEPGTLAGLVVDWCGEVYVTDFFGDVVFGFDGLVGGPAKFQRGVNGKPCQAPALNRNGMLFFGTSQDSQHNGTREVHGVKPTVNGDTSLDWTETAWRAGPGAPGDFGDFFGGVLIRPDAGGTAYLADANPDTDTGAVYSFSAGAPTMAGGWPSLGCGNRRQHKSRTYPYTVLELTSFISGDPTSQAVFSVDANGRAVGYAHGNPGYPNFSLPIDWYGAYWPRSTGPLVLGSVPSVPSKNYARAANLAGHAVGWKASGPVVWPNGFTGGNPQALPLPPGLGGGEARDINASSSIIGFSFAASPAKVVRWDFNGSTWDWVLVGAPDNGQAYAYALSDTRRICGKAMFTGNGPWLGYTSPPFVDDFLQVVPLGTFGGPQSEAFEVNDLSGTVGWAHKHIGASDYHRAFHTPTDVFTLDSTHELPGFAGQLPGGTWQSEAWSISGCGWVVGWAHDSSGASRAFLLKPGATVLTDLTSLASTGWVLTTAIGVSDTGYIVGSGTRSGASRQWMMFPTPQE